MLFVYCDLRETDGRDGLLGAPWSLMPCWLESICGWGRMEIWAVLQFVGWIYTFEAQTLEAPPPNLQWFLFLESDPPTTGTDRESQWHILIGLIVNDVILICYMNSQILKKSLKKKISSYIQWLEYIHMIGICFLLLKHRLSNFFGRSNKIVFYY